MVGVKLGCTEVQGAVQVGVGMVESDVRCSRNHNRVGGVDGGCNGCSFGFIRQNRCRAGGSKGESKGKGSEFFHG